MHIRIHASFNQLEHPFLVRKGDLRVEAEWSE